MSLIDTLRKMRGAQAEMVRESQIDDAEQFREFYNTKYYKKFRDDLAELAMNTGLDATSTDQVLEANGKRKAYLELIKRLDRLETLAKEILYTE